MSQTWTALTHNAQATQALAAQLAPHLCAADVIWLSGDLGAGKTTFTQGLGKGLQIDVPIVSPTFVLIREYQGRLPLYHIDLYRLENPREVINLGLRDYLGGAGVCVVEWAERFDAHGDLPGLHVRIESPGADTRALKFTAADERAMQLLTQWQNTWMADHSSYAARH